MKNIPRFTFGSGDRFGHQGRAQLKAVMDARAAGIEVAPVWNKSRREHSFIGSVPQSLRDEADDAVRALGYDGVYFVDADHITLATVDEFIGCCDFFTLDVAEDLGRPPADSTAAARYTEALLALGEVALEGRGKTLVYGQAQAQELVQRYGGSIEAAGRLYERISAARSDGDFVIEVSMDETGISQGPQELLGILAMLAAESIPVQTIAPKFTGRFNKGVDYAGDIDQFRAEFEGDILAVRYAVANLGVPAGLKLSVHSGSDKFTLYPIIRELIARHRAGLHLKTAGTTWLEEVAGLAEAGGEALAFVRKLYCQALADIDALAAPYASVLDIDRSRLPSAAQAASWTSAEAVAMIAHEPHDPRYNPSLRQLLHVAFKLAALAGEEFTGLLERHASIISRRVCDNLCRKHILRVFPAAE
jgi:tagaturonate epimerase